MALQFDRAKKNAANLAWYHAHKETVNARRAERYKNRTPEEIAKQKVYTSAYYATHAEEYKVHRNERYRTDPVFREKMKQAQHDSYRRKKEYWKAHPDEYEEHKFKLKKKRIEREMRNAVPTV